MCIYYDTIVENRFPCDSNPCMHNGECRARRVNGITTSYECRCDQEYDGDRCENRISK